MKKNFFTLLALLMLVTVNAVAQDPETVNVPMNSLGTKTFVCDKNLDFSSLNAVDKNLVPFYISDYSEVTNTFTLSRFADDRVPAYTPMVLMVAYPEKWDGSAFDVPTYSATNTSLNKARAVANANSKYFYMVPVTTGTYIDDEDEEVYAFLPDAERGKISNGKYAVRRSISIKTGEKLVKTYYPYKEYAELVELAENNPDAFDALIENGFFYHEVEEKTKLGKTTYIHYYRFWQGENEIVVDPSSCQDEDGWFRSSWQKKYVNYTQFILARSGKKAVFQRCSDGEQGNPVSVGGCFIRINSDLSPVAASRESIDFDFADEEEIGDISGIKVVKDAFSNEVIYNINGQKLVKLQKGLNIINGKKIFVK